VRGTIATGSQTNGDARLDDHSLAGMESAREVCNDRIRFLFVVLLDSVPGGSGIGSEGEPHRGVGRAIKKFILRPGHRIVCGGTRSLTERLARDQQYQ